MIFKDLDSMVEVLSASFEAYMKTAAKRKKEEKKSKKKAKVLEEKLAEFI